MKIAFLFPGQGAQYVGMGQDFAQAFSAARLCFDEADHILERSLQKTIFEGPDEELTKTRNSQVGIYVTSMAILAALQEQFRDLQPAICAGFSLGEYSAITASHRLGFTNCLPLVQARANFMQEACESVAGTMAAVVGLSAEEVVAAVDAVNMPNDLWIANFNCPGQVVISGTKAGIAAGIEAVKAKGAKRAIPLRVSGAFHSGLMQSAQAQMQQEVPKAPLQPSEIGLVMNVTGELVSDLDTVRQLMVEQVTSSVRWEQGIRVMDQTGIDLYIEIGCGKALAGFNKRIGVAGQTITIDKVADLDLLSQQLEAVTI